MFTVTVHWKWLLNKNLSIFHFLIFHQFSRGGSGAPSEHATGHNLSCWIRRIESDSERSTTLRSVCHYCRSAFVHRSSSAVTAFPRRRAGVAARPPRGRYDEKSCWRSSTEYNSIWSRTSSPRRPPFVADRECCYYRNGSIRVTTLAERSRICGSAPSKFCNSLNLSTLTMSQLQAVVHEYATHALKRGLRQHASYFKQSSFGLITHADGSRGDRVFTVVFLCVCLFFRTMSQKSMQLGASNVT